MEMRRTGLAVVTALMLVAIPLVAQQREQAQQPAKPTQMSMDNMMKGCQEHHQTMSRSLDQLVKTVAEAKQSNDSTKMRLALDQVQTHMTEMQQQMKSCMSMMDMMQHMMSMHGSESQPPK
jgi:competence protein ComGC